MKKPTRILAVLALSLFAACGGGASAAVGTYHLDVDGMIAAMPEMKEVPADVKKNFKGSIELKADHSATMVVDFGMPMMPKQETTGTWKLDGTTLSMTSKKGDKEETKTAKLENGKITIEGGEGDKNKKMQMVFVKK